MGDLRNASASLSAKKDQVAQAFVNDTRDAPWGEQTEVAWLRCSNIFS